MRAERWRQITDLLHRALMREPQERAAFLGEACAGDPSLQSEIQSLIAAHDGGRHLSDTRSRRLSHCWSLVLVSATIESMHGWARVEWARSTALAILSSDAT